MNNYYTYAYLREDGTPYYIGKGEGYRAYHKGRGEIKPPKDKSKILYLKQNITEEEAFKHEIYMIAILGRKDIGTGRLRNRTDGGEGSSGRVLSQKSLEKIKKSHTGKILSEEHKKKIGLKIKGRKYSPETICKMREAKKGKKLSEEHKKKMSESHKGIMHTEETKQKMSAAAKGRKPYNTGKKLSEEHKKKISETFKKIGHPNEGKKWWNNGQISRMSVECPVGKEWVSGRIKK